MTTPPAQTAPPSYCVLFKTHFWDAYTERQLQRLQKANGRGDLYVVIDDTFEKQPSISFDKVLHITAKSLADLRLAPYTTHGSVLWYNNDYQQYVALAELPPYDYYLSVEYDIVLDMSLDSLVDRLHADGVDFLGSYQRTPPPEWPWYDMHLPVYGKDMLVMFASVAAFSRAGLQLLLERRQAHEAAFLAGELPVWPHCEGFQPNEIRNAGLKIATLSDYGNVDNYDWWPPINEANLPAPDRGPSGEPAFLHPVLHGSRYIRSLAHHEPSVGALFRADSAFGRKTSGMDRALVRKVLRQEFRHRALEKYRRTMEQMGLKPHWSSNVLAKTRKSLQETQPHNRA